VNGKIKTEDGSSQKKGGKTFHGKSKALLFVKNPRYF
jgi:hypothetical protein